MTITSFPSSVQAGGVAVVQGTSSGCLDIIFTVTFNGVVLGSPPVSLTCSNGNWTLKIDPVPAKVPGEQNVLSVLVEQGGSDASCDIQVI